MPYHSVSIHGFTKVIFLIDGLNYFDMTKSIDELNTSPGLEINKALRRLEKELSSVMKA